jgi:hypothetical protein
MLFGVLGLKADDFRTGEQVAAEAVQVALEARAETEPGEAG